jgi:hypothetical protein
LKRASHTLARFLSVLQHRLRRPNGLCVSRRERAAQNDIKIPAILRAKRSAARTCWARARNSLQEIYLWSYTAAKNVYNSVNDILKWLPVQLPNPADHQASMGSEQLARAGITSNVERTSRKVSVCQRQSAWITIGCTGDLAQNPIVPTDIGQDDRRAQLGLR